MVPDVHSNRSVEEVLNHVSFQPRSISRIHPSFFTAHQKSQTTRSYKFLSVLAPKSVVRVFGSWRSTATITTTILIIIITAILLIIIIIITTILIITTIITITISSLTNFQTAPTSSSPCPPPSPPPTTSQIVQSGEII